MDNNKDEIKFKIKYDKNVSVINNIQIKKIPNGDELGKLIIDDNLINNKSLDFRAKIKLSKDYNILCSETAFYAEIQNEVPIKEKMETITNKDKNAINNNKIENEELEVESELRNMGYENKNYNINNNEIEENNEENNKKGFLSWLSSIFFCRKEKNKIINKKSFEYKEVKRKERISFPKLKSIDYMVCNCMKESLEYNCEKSINIISKNEIKQFNESYENENKEKCRLEEKCCKSISDEADKILNFDDIILGQDIIEGNWKRDNNNEILIEKEKDLFEKIKQYSESKGINDENGIITLFILYYIFKKKSEKVEELKFVIDKAKKYIKKIFNFEYDDIAKELDSN